MKTRHTDNVFEANDVNMFRELLIGYDHSKKSSQKVMFEEVNKEFTVKIVHFISFDSVSDDCCILHVINNGTSDVQVNLPSKSFSKLLKHAEAFRY